MIERLADLLTFDAVTDSEFRADALAPRLPSLEECTADPRVLTPPFDPQHDGFIPGSYSMSLALVVAASTVDPVLAPISLHATYLRAGNPGESVQIKVERTQDARRHARRRVLLAHEDATFLVCDVGLHRPDAPDGGWARDAPVLLAPDTLAMAPSTFYLPIMETRPVGGAQINAMYDNPFPLWARFPHGLPKSPAWSAAALLWAADYFPAQAMLVASGRSAHEYIARTIEHSMWFHCSVDPTAWIQIDYEAVSLADQRYHTIGAIYDHHGTLAATMIQMGIMLRPPT